MEYPNTFSALQSLQYSLSCTKCHTLRSTLCTLGGCQHLFCRECCSSLVGTSCPECQIPVHVKDAQVNKQLSNLVSLCQELGRILVSGSHGDDGGDQPINNETVTDIDENLGVSNLQQTSLVQSDIQKEIGKTKRKSNGKENKNKKAVSRATRLRQSLGKDGGVSDLELEADDTKMEDKIQNEEKPELTMMAGRRSGREATVRSRKSVRATKLAEKEDTSEKLDESKGDNSARRGRSRSRSKTNQVSKLQNFTSNTEAESGNEETPAKKGRKSKKGEKTNASRRSTKMTEKAADQSTMTQFYDCSDDESDENSPDEENTSVHSGPSRRNREESRQRANNSSKSRKKNTEKAVDQKTMTQFYDYEDEMPLLEMPEDTKIEPEKLTVVKKRSAKAQRSKSKEKQSQESIESSGTKSKKGKGSVKTSPVFRSSPVKRGRRSLTGSQGEPPVKRNALGETPLQVAAIKGDLERVKALLEAGAKPNVRDHAGWTPLHESCNHGYTTIVELLLDHGALINVPGPENDTPLHDAVSNYRLEVVSLLVSRGAAINARNIHGRTPKDFATTDEMRQILESGSSEQMDTADITEVQGEDEFIPLCFLGTALPRDEGRKLQKCASVLQAKLVDTFSPDVSHVVTSTNNHGQCPRTLKYLHAVLAGKWVVSLEWLDMCLEYQQKVCEEAFEVPGSSTNPDSHAAMKGRLNRRQQLPGLFDGCQFYFYGTFQNPEKEELQSLVRNGGGTFLSREPKIHNLDDYSHTVPYHASSSSRLKDCGLYIVHDKTLAYPSVTSSRLCAVPSNWIMECIASFSLVDP